MIILTLILMAGYFFIDAPSQKMYDYGLESTMRTTDVKSVLFCMARAHKSAVDIDSKKLAGAREIFQLPNQPCIEKYNIQTIKLCADNYREVSNCIPARPDRITENFIITTADINQEKNTNLILKILSQDFNSISNFGIIVSKNNYFSILSGDGQKRYIPISISRFEKFKDGQLVYITRYPLTFNNRLMNQTKDAADNIFCMNNEQKIFRFGRWECQAENPPILCTGDTIWSSESESCVIDPSRRPLCSAGQTAIEIDDIWRCVDPLPTIKCPENTVLQFDYANMEWVCSTPISTNTSKCKNVIFPKRTGNISGGTLLKPANFCNNCEKMILNEETCVVSCIPDATKITNPACYPNASECTGNSRAFYFGFPEDAEYETNARENLPQLSDVQIPNDAIYSQNRKFNCLDCGEGGQINQELSVPPFIAICE
jgi:hypothetical protein